MKSDIIRILLVDDHTILREGIKSLLDDQDHMTVVGEAGDGERGVEAVEELRPDVVLMDISMPNLNGIAATEVIREKSPDTKILILTMHDQEEYVYPIFRAGASGYVVKRSATRELVSAIEAVMQGNTILHPSITESLLEDRDGGQSEGMDAASVGEKGRSCDNLTDREIEVLILVAEGLTNREIAEELHIAVKTVQAHRANIMEKLDLHDRVDLTKYAIRNGLISL